MPVIYSYPTKDIPTGSDLLIISDVSNLNRTRKTTFDAFRASLNLVDGSGTANRIPKWSDSNTLTDSVITDQGNDIIIPRFIKREGETTNAFGFTGPGQFIVSVGPSTADQFSVEANSIIIKTDSGNKLEADATGVTLYNDENGSTTVSKQSLVTYDSGIIVKGGTENSFARGGAVRFYTSTNDGYVGIKGPTTSGTNYEIILPNAVGTADQVLKLPSTIGSTPYQLAWGDASGGGGGVPGGSTGSVQFKNSSSEFAGDAGFTFTNGGGVPKLTIGNTGSDVGGIIEIQSDENGAELKIGGGSQAYYTSIKGSDSDTANYNIILPPAGPGGNNKILESTSAGILSWIATPTGGGGVSSFTNTNGTFISAGTANSAATGAVTMGTIDLSATGTADNTTFLRGDNQWIIPTNTTYNAMTTSTLGLGKLRYTTGSTPAAETQSVDANRTYGITANDADQLVVNVPWVDTNTAPVDSVSAGTSGASSGSALTVSPTTGAVKVTSNSYAGTTNVGHVPTGGSNTKFLRGDGTWVVPTNTTYTTATSGTLGLVKIGYTENGKNYPVELASEKMYVNVPWTDTNYEAGTGLTLTGTVFSSDLATSTARGSIELFSDTDQSVEANTVSTTAARTYGLQLNESDQGVVNVPWTDTVTPVVTASQGLTKTSNNITLDIADPTNGWAILGGGAGATTPVIVGYAGANATGTKNYGISNFISSSTVTSANSNVAVGFDSMGTSVSTASNNVVIGSSAGASMTTATDSVLIGQEAGNLMTTAPDVVLIGQDAGKGITTGGENTIIGSNAGETITTGTRNTIIGSGAIAGTGSASVFSVVVGREASATSSSTAVGSGAIVAGATGIAVGDQASVASTATNGIALGKGAQATLQGAVGNVAIGSSANPVSLDQPEEFSAEFSYLNVTINGNQYYIRLYTAG